MGARGHALNTIDTIVPRADILFMHCPKCVRALTFRRYRNGGRLVASCCDLVFDCFPYDQDGKLFRIRYKEADMSNVIKLSVVDK